MKLTKLIAYATLFLGVSDGLLAQVGTLNERTEFAVMYGAGLAGKDAPIRGIVIWQGPSGWARSHGERDARRTDSVLFAAQSRAKPYGGHVFGDGKRMAYYCRMETQ